jgi:FAD/FMN-containing dehydrogenase
VTPGTQYVTVGGAIANDVHGKNHHRVGSFGSHVIRFELLRSDGTRLQCSPEENQEWFGATIGGLGMTGLITWAELKLRRIESAYISTRTLRYRSLDEFFELSAGSDARNEYTVAWVDCSANGQGLGRGLFSHGDHASTIPSKADNVSKSSLSFPLTPPLSLVNGLSLRLFNVMYYHRPWAETGETLQHYRPFLYPLDGLQHWNRMYGPRGFFQHQSVVPLMDGKAVIRSMLEYIQRSGAGSFLAVLKLFGNQTSPGMLSFPRPGVTLAVDFPNRGERTLKLLAGLDRIVDEAGGAIYPAKDARMTAVQFRRYFPQWQRFAGFVDPKFSSGFWRRISG